MSTFHRGAPARLTRRLAIALSVYALIGGLSSFAGWAVDVPKLSDWDNDGIAIQPNAALAAVFSALSLFALLQGSRRASLAAALVVFGIGSLTLVEYVSGVTLGIDDALLFGREWGRRGVLWPGRMGPPGATAWTVIGVSLLMASSNRVRVRTAAPFLVLAAALVASLSLVGYLYGAQTLYTIPTLTVIAFQTSTFILALSISLILAVEEHGPMRVLGDPGPAGILFRRLLPGVIVLPVVLGFLRLGGERAGLYDLAFGTAARTLVEIVLLLALVAWTSRTVARHGEARAQVEATLAQREHDLRTTLESLTDGLVTIDREFRFQYVNAAAVRLLHKPRPDLLGRTMWSVFPELIDSVTHRELHRIMAGGDRVEFEDFNPGLKAWFFNNAYPTPEGGVTVHFRNVTQEKETALALQRSRELLESDLADSLALQTLSATSVHEDDVNALYDRVLTTAMTLVASQFASMQMAETDPVSGRPTGLRLLASRGLNERARTFWARVNDESDGSSHQSLRSSERLEIPDVLTSERLAHTDDVQVYLDTGIRAVQSTPLISRSGKLLGMLSTHWAEPHTCTGRELRLLDIVARQAADIVERHQQEGALRDADRRKDVFLMTLAHELRNPLAPIRSAADVLKRMPLPDPDIHRLCDIIDRQSSVMARLLDDLLDVGRIARDRLELRSEPVEMQSIVRGAVEMSAPLVKSYQHRLDVSVPEAPIFVSGDPVRLSQVIGNLLNNSCRYTEPQGRISVVLEEKDLEAVVTVSDNGIGIPSDRLASIFEIFSQVDPSLQRSQGGLGIGLYLVKRLVELHSGRVEARSDGPGAGSTFTVHLPVFRPSAVPARPDVPVILAAGVHGRRVLIVDDNVDAAEMLSALLELSHHHTTIAHDGDEALSKAAVFLPDVVLLDIGLPKVSGYDVCRQLRAQPWGTTTTVIAVTGWGQEADRARSQDAGFDHHLVKPVDHEALLSLLATLPARSSPVQ